MLGLQKLQFILLVENQMSECIVLFVQSLLYLPFAIANALTARLNDGCVEVTITQAF